MLEVIKAALVAAACASGLVACGEGVQLNQRQQAEARVIVSYPQCNGIEDDRLRIKCIKAASKIEVDVDGEGVIDVLSSLPQQ